MLALLERTYFLPLFILIVAAFLINAPLSESFWLDETLTFWIIKDSAKDVWFRSTTFQGQTPFYYFVLHYWSQVFGASEIALRSFSISCGVLSAILFGRILVHLNLKPVILGMSFLFVHDSLVPLWFSARPYAFTFFWIILSTYLLLEYRTKGGFFRGLSYALSGAAVFYAHYLGALIFLVHFAIIRRVSIFLWVGFFSSLGVPHLVSILGRKDEIFFDGNSEISVFLSVFLPSALMTISLVGLVLCAIVKGEKKPRFNGVGIIWWIVSAVVFFVTIWFLPNVSRYYFWAAPAVVILLVSFFWSVKVPSIATAVMCLLCLMLNLERKWETQDYRGIANKLLDANKPVLFYSGLAEHKGEPTSIDPAFLTEYLSSPLTVYGAKNIIPVNLKAIPQMLEELSQNEVFLVAKNDEIGETLVKTFNCEAGEGRLFIVKCKLG